MTLYRNVGSVPLDGFADTRMLYPQDDRELTEDDLELDAVTSHLEQGTLVPVTLAGTAPTPAATQSAAQK